MSPENQQYHIEVPPAESLPPKHFSPLKRYQKAFWIYLSVIALLVAGLIVFLVFFRNGNNEPSLLGEVKLEAEVPEGSASGAELLYKITVENASNVKLTNLNLEFFYPRGFSFIDSTPDSQDPGARQFSFADLEPGGQYQVIIVGRLEGSVQDIKTFNAKLHYVPENFRSSFVVERQAATQILAPGIAFQLNAPPHLVTGQTIQYGIQLTNVASRSFSDLIVRLTYPEKFEFLEATPQPTKEKNEWKIGYLGIGEAQKILISGKLFEIPDRESFVQADLFFKNNEGDEISAGRSFAFTQIRPSPLVLTHYLVNIPQAVLPSQSLTYEVTYENTSETGLNNVMVSVVFLTSVFDPAKISSTTGQFRVGSQALVWVPTKVPELLVVAPRQKGKLSFSVPVSGELVAKLQKNPKVITRVEYTSKELTEPVVGNSLEVKVQTEVKIAASAKIIGGEIPPAPGKMTTFQIELAVTNGVNDLKEAELVGMVLGPDSSVVPGSIVPADEQDNVVFVPVAGTLRWNVGNIFAFSGTYHDSRKLVFNLNVIPAVNDFTPDPVLLKDVQVFATDEFTGNKISSNKIENLRAK